jgi:hypothetical protein
MSEQWAYKIGTKQSSPVSVAAMCRLIERGALSPTVRVRELPNGPWLALAETPFASIEPKPEPAAPVMRTAAQRVRTTPPTPPDHAATVAALTELWPTVGKMYTDLNSMTSAKIAGYLTWATVIGCFAFSFWFISSISNSVEANRAARHEKRVENDAREKAQRDSRDRATNQFRATEVNLSALKQMKLDKKEALGKAVNAADRQLIENDFTDKACKQLRGGKINALQGSLYSISAGGAVSIAVDGLTLVASVPSDGPLYRKFAQVKPATWTKNGDSITIDGFFDQRDGNSACLNLKNTYSIELTSVR